jgi:hypothetical protein
MASPQEGIERETDRKRHGRRPYGDRGRDWSEASTSQGMPGISRTQMSQGRVFPYSLQRRCNPAEILT